MKRIPETDVAQVRPCRTEQRSDRTCHLWLRLRFAPAWAMRAQNV